MSQSNWLVARARASANSSMDFVRLCESRAAFVINGRSSRRDAQQLNWPRDSFVAPMPIGSCEPAPIFVAADLHDRASCRAAPADSVEFPVNCRPVGVARSALPGSHDAASQLMLPLIHAKLSGLLRVLNQVGSRSRAHWPPLLARREDRLARAI